MLTCFQCDMCHFRNMKIRYPNREIQENDRLMIAIWREFLAAFWSRWSGTVGINLTMLRNMGMMFKEQLGLEGWFPLLGPYTLKYKMGMGLACVTLRLLPRKGVHVEHLQQYIMRKSPTEWGNIYGYGLLGMSDTIFTRFGKHFTDTACTNQGMLFGNLMR